jgi:endoglycosylceramidase
VLHGVNISRKTAPWYPENFTAQDAQFLKSERFNAARIGFSWTGVEPQPGVYDDAYISKFVQFEKLLAQYGIRTVIDFHQDLWSSQTCPHGQPSA